MPDSSRAPRIAIGEFDLVLTPGMPRDVLPGRQATRGIVHATLARALRDPMLIAQLRSAVESAGETTRNLDDARLINLVAVRVELGHWLLEPRKAVHAKLSEPPVTDLRDLAAPEHEEQAVANHYIEIELVGTDDQPVGQVPYRIELPGGRVVGGTTDAQGIARVVGIHQAGACRISFPTLDADAWEPL